MLGVYLHIPFCARRCDYCDFFVVVDERPEGRFLGWLQRDLEAAAVRLRGRAAADTLYLGGGTPSYIDPGWIAALVQACRRLFDLAADAEVTLEANPEGVTPDRLDAWVAAGVTRLSLGIQSLRDEVLRPRGRLYAGAQACAALARARAAGFASVGADLIAGLPGETVAGFQEGLDRLVRLSPDHVSVYLLETAEAGKDTSLARAAREGRERPGSEDEVVAMYAAAAERLAAAGYRHYEISNFARPGHASRHNLKYWRSEEYLGAGPSAHSLLDGRRFARPADIAAWSSWVGAGGDPRELPDDTLPAAAARAREALVMELRLLEGVDLDRFARARGLDPREALAAELEELASAGLLRLQGSRLALTPRGLLLSNEVFARLA